MQTQQLLYLELKITSFEIPQFPKVNISKNNSQKDNNCSHKTAP